MIALTLLSTVNSSFAATSATPRKHDEVRVVVTFKRPLSPTSRQSLHLDLKMNFLKHFETTNSDLVNVRTGKTLTKVQARQRGKAICARYQQSPLVKSCVPAI